MASFSLVRTFGLFTPLALALLAGCADEESDNNGSGDTGGTTLTIEAAIESGTPAVGQNAMIVTLTDEAGDPVVGATVTVDPQMPSMGHGSSEVAVVADNGDGTYRAFPVTFQMGGPWTVTIDAEAGDATGQLVLDYNVAGGMGGMGGHGGR
jgi:hypothetical protein